MAANASLLDELMGAHRNALPGERASGEVEWKESDVSRTLHAVVHALDQRRFRCDCTQSPFVCLCPLPIQVCKDFLCGFCPTQLFTNTRADIGRHYEA